MVHLPGCWPSHSRPCYGFCHAAIRPGCFSAFASVQPPEALADLDNHLLRCLEIFHLPLGGDDAKGYRTAVRALAHHQLEGLLLLLVPFQYFAALPFL